jgi:hypothetical protein
MRESSRTDLLTTSAGVGVRKPHLHAVNRISLVCVRRRLVATHPRLVTFTDVEIYTATERCRVRGLLH